MARGAGSVPQLVITQPAEIRGDAFRLSEPENIIGHSPSATITIANSYVSRRHALITIDTSGTATIHDLNSTGGTFVNEAQLTGPRVLQRGDLIRFGDQVVARFEPARAAPPASGPETLQSPTVRLPVPVSDPTPVATAPVPAVPDVPDAGVTGTTETTTGGAESAGTSGAAAVVMPLPVTESTPAAGPTLAQLAPFLGAGSAALLRTLASRGISTLADVRQTADLGSPTTAAQAAALKLVVAHADLGRLSPDIAANAVLIANGFTSSLQVARSPQAVFVAAAAPALGEAGAVTMHAQAVAMYAALDQVLIGAHLDLASAAGTTGLPGAVNAAINPDIYQRCSCDDCQAATSPTAYLADLINYATTHLLAYGQNIGLPYLIDNFHQPFGDLPTDCAAVQTMIRQVRICAEVLRSYQVANPPTAAQKPLLDAALAAYLARTYQALLAGLGTSLDELRLAGTASPAIRSALADRLGLAIDPYRGSRPDALDQMLLTPQATVPPPPPAQVISEASIERLSGLADTTRNPLSDGQVTGDPGGIIGRWNLDGVTWGLNTGPDGSVYLWLAQPGAGQLDVALYKDKGFTQLVAFGQLSPPGTGLPASITLAPENNSGLSGTIEVTQAIETQAISLGAIPQIAAWQLQALRADWLTEDHPADPYMAGISSVPLAAMPAGIGIPAALQTSVSYNATAQLVISTGVLAPADLVQLLQPAQGNAAATAYVNAVNALYVASQRQPVIDPDVIGPDDFRVPLAGAAAASQPFGLWVSRRGWADAQLIALGSITEAAPGGGTRPSFTGMLAWMHDDLTYGGVTAAPWAATTPVTALEALWENLAQGVTVPAIMTQLASDLCLTPQAFNRLMDLWHADQATAAVPPGPALTAADWGEVASLLTQAAKTRFFAVWRAEEAALPLDFGSATFIVSLREPLPGDWPPVPPPGPPVPLIDPAIVPPTGLPEPTVLSTPAGARALQFWTSRQAAEAALTTGLRTANETNGFQAMLEQALGDPDAGDPLPADIDTLAQQLTSPDPAAVAAATTAITGKLFLTAAQFQLMMRLRARAADPNPANHPTPAQWLTLYAILTTAETTKRLYPLWVTQENDPASGVTYWTALKASLPPWRASTMQRAQWHAGLTQRSGPPIIDPDLIGPADMVNPVPADPAYGMWQQRATTVGGLVPGPFPAPATTAALDALLLAAIGLDGTALAAIATQASNGTDITSRLAQLTLTYDAFTELMTVYNLVAAGLGPIDTEQSAFLAILTQAQKQRMFAQWRQQEASAAIIAGPDEFVLQPATARTPRLPAWRASASDRQAWTTTLQARIEQQGTVLAAAGANADAAEGATLTDLRDALVQTSNAPGPSLAAKADWLTENLMIDAHTGGTVKTTRIEQAIETLQDLMTGLRAGETGGLELQLQSAPAVISWIAGSDRYDVFAVGPGRALWHKYWDGTSWSGWENLGGVLTSAPVAVTRLAGTLDVFATGTDSAVWHLGYSGGTWASSWDSLGGLCHQGPGAGAPEIDSIDVFAVGTDNQLWQRTSSAGDWGGWVQAARTAPLPAYGIASAPCVTGTNGSYDIFVQGGDSALWHTSYDGAAWTGWTSLGGTLTSAPSATSANGPLQVFARFTDNAIWSLTTQPDGSWAGSQWTSLGGFATYGPGALAENNVFAVSAAGALEHKWLDAQGWHGWYTTTPLSLNAPYFDAEWAWIGSYSTWRAAMMVRFYPENILDPAVRSASTQTPGFTALVSAVQNSASLSLTQATQFAATYDTYFRDVCSLEVTLSCSAPPVPPGSPEYMFGVAANSGSVYWSSYNPASQADYAQTFWDVVPGLSGQQISLGAATALIDGNGALWVLLVVAQNTANSSSLLVLRYNTGTNNWDPDGPYTLDLPPGWTSVTARLGYQGNPQHQLVLGENTAQYAPFIAVTLPDNSQYERQLSDGGTGWLADSSFVRVGSWGPWSQALQAPVSSGQPIASVSRMAGQIDLFWVNYAANGANTVSTASATAGSSGGLLGGATQIGTFTTTTRQPAFQNYQTPLAAVARSATHLDVFALGARGGAWTGYVPDGGSGENDVYWASWDAGQAGGDWQDFQQISSGSPGDPEPLLDPGSSNYVQSQIAAVARGNALHVFVLVAGALYTNWTNGPPGSDDWNYPWISIPGPTGGAALSLVTAVCSDPQYVDVQVTDSNGAVSGFRWTANTPWSGPNFPNWYSVNYGGQKSGGISGTVLAESPDIYEFFFLAKVAASATVAPLQMSRMDQTGPVRAFSTISLGGGLYVGATDPYGTPIAAVQRGQSRVEVYAAAAASPRPAIYTRASDDPAAGTWSQWATVGGTGGDISTLAKPWSVSAVSQQALRTDLFVALYGGISGDQGGIYTTYFQDVDFAADPPDLPPFAIPAVTAPLDIPAQLSSPDLQTRAQAIQSAFAANGGAPESTLTYLKEAYYFVPVYLANQLVQQGQFQAALDWYRTVYDYAVPEQIRDIYYGLVLEEGLPNVASTLPANWLADPLDPHAIAATRRDAYTRYTVLQIVQCMFSWADSLFTTDTSESDAEARGLYLAGLALLALDIFNPLDNPCGELLIQVSEIFPDPEWAPLLAGLTDDMAKIGSPTVLAGLVPNVLSALGGKAAWADRFVAARKLITAAQRAVPAPRTVGDVLGSGAAQNAAAYSALLSVSTVDAAATSVSAATAAALTPAASPAVSGSQPTSESRQAIKTITHLGQPPPNPPPPPQQLPGWFKLPVADFWFCIPANPMVTSLRNVGQLRLYELRNGMNIAGQARQLAPYSAPTDPGSGLPSLGPGGQLDVSAPLTRQPTPYPYATLIARAQQLVQTAQNIEAQMLAALQQRDQDLYEELQARQNLTVTTATVQLQALTVQQAADSVTLARLQQQTAQLQASHWQQMLGSNIGRLEQSAIAAMQTSRDLQVASAAASAAAAVASAASGANIASWGGTSLSAVATGLTSAAAAASTQAAINNAQASYETQQDDWQFQYQLANASIQTAGQQIQIATDQQAVASQQLVIAQLQASNAQDTVNFLANKFTNAALYDWMANVLQSVYSFFLQQATAVALLAENQLAFERQQLPAGYIKSGYWQPASANLVAASTPDNTMGLTGAEQLNADITKLDQYAFTSNQRKLELTKTISLARLYPIEFMQLRQTGELNFSTTLAQFDQDYPGHYLRLIEQVSTTIIALIPTGQNISATLSCTGVSQVVVGPDPFQTVTVRTDPQSVAITTPVGATGVFTPDPQATLLLPFQDLGVATQWKLSVPLASNQFDFASLADAQMTFSYTAIDDPGYRAQVIQSLNGQISQERPYSFVNDLPDAWYDLNNPDQTPTPMTVQFDVAAGDLPANLAQIQIQQIVLYFTRTPGQIFEIDVNALQFFPAGSPVAIGGAATTIGGVISTRRGNAPAWTPMIGSSPFGTWQLTLPDTAEVRGWFTGGLITDILFDITYTAQTPAWPA
jgi:pSer/pThr/pTyr-binding forkhead associated (FHA) protein